MIGSTKSEKIYGSFAYLTFKDKINKDWSKKLVSNTLLQANKKAIELLETEKYYSVDIMYYNPKKMSWELVSSKLKSKM